MQVGTVSGGELLEEYEAFAVDELKDHSDSVDRNVRNCGNDQMTGCAGPRGTPSWTPKLKHVPYHWHAGHQWNSGRHLVHGVIDEVKVAPSPWAKTLAQQRF